MVAVLMLNESGYENVIAVVFCGKPQYRANVSRHAVFSATYAGVDRCAVLTDESYPPVGGVDAAATMKLFVGQIPKSMAEEDLRRYFEPFGPLIEVAIIRDRVTGTHRGCAFVTYESAASGMACIAALHDKVTLEPMTCAMQVKPADGQSERRVFVGQLDGRHDRGFLQSLFERFGSIEDIRFLREADGTGHGAAVISFRTQESAHAAVSAMDKMLPHEGADTPLLVRFAFESKRGTGHKRPTQASQGLGAGAAIGFGGNHTSSHSGWLLPPPTGVPPPGQDGGVVVAHSPVYPHGTSGLYGGASTPYGTGVLSNVYGGFPSPLAAAYGAVVPAGVDSSPPPTGGTAASSQTRTQGQVGSGATVPQPYHFPPEYAAYAYGYAPAATTAYAYGYAPASAPGHFGGSSPAPQDGASKPPQATVGRMDGSDAARGSYAHVGVAYHMLSPQYGGAEASSGSVGGPKQTQGPPGANLFVYHLPPQLRDGDLRELFRTFGNILSAKVYTDRRTDESKGFGFVSYDSPLSAEAAIASMNGYPIGLKRLKVQHKRGYLEETRYAAERVQREAYLNSVRQGGGPLDVPVESLVASMRVSE